MRSLLLNVPYWWNDPDKAAELLGRDFRDDSETRETIRAELARHYPALGLRAVWVLAAAGEEAILAGQRGPCRQC